MIDALVARAAWHLELGYFEVKPMIEAERRAADDAEFDGGYLGESITCWGCGGEGTEINCCDDLCHGQGWCMHGDGERACPQCGGEGLLPTVEGA